MSSEPANPLGRFLLTVLVLGTLAGAGWWFLEGPGRPDFDALFDKPVEAATKPDPATKFMAGGHFWFTPDDFLGQGTAVVSDEPKAPATEIPAPASEPDPVPEPAPKLLSPVSPSIKVTRTTNGASIGAHTMLVEVQPGVSVSDALTIPPPPELEAYDRQIERKLRGLWTVPTAADVPEDVDRVVMIFTLGRDGAVLKSREVQMSGNNPMDRSVLYATALFINAGMPVPRSHKEEEYEVSAEFRLR